MSLWRRRIVASVLRQNWPQYELDGLVARESDGRKVVLPSVVLRLTK
jgi:hypothetical protein